MVVGFSNPPAWLSEAEFEEFNDITSDKIKSWTSLPKLRRLEKYMREEGFIQTADVAHKRIAELEGSNSDYVQPGMHTGDIQDMLKSIEFWQVNMKEKDAELQKLQGSRKSITHDSEKKIPKVRKLISEIPEIPESDETKRKGKQKVNEEEKPKTMRKNDIRSGREYYEGWDKYVTKWEKEADVEPEEPTTESSCQKANKRPERMKRKETKLSEMAPIEREWLANREREKGNDLFKAKEYNASLQAYTKSIETYDGSSVTYANRAAVYLKMNRFDEAYADCNQALKLDPKNSKALMRRAKASLEMDEASKALNDINDGLKLDPRNEDLLHLKKTAEDAVKKHISIEVARKDLLPNSRRFAIEEVESIMESTESQDSKGHGTDKSHVSLVEDTEESKKCPVEEMAEAKLLVDRVVCYTDETESKEPPVEDMAVPKEIQDVPMEGTDNSECKEPPVEDMALPQKIQESASDVNEETEYTEPPVEDMAVPKQIHDLAPPTTEETEGKECPVEGMVESNQIQDPAEQNSEKCSDSKESVHKARRYVIEEIEDTSEGQKNVENASSHVSEECKQSPVDATTECKLSPADATTECKLSPADATTECKLSPADATTECNQSSVDATTECKQSPVDATTECKQSPVDATAECKQSPVDATAECKISPADAIAECKLSPADATAECKLSPADATAECKLSPADATTECKLSLADATAECKVSLADATLECKVSPTDATTECKQSPADAITECKQSPADAITECNNNVYERLIAMSKKWHEKGNTFFRNGNFKDAYECYTQSLVHAPNNAVVMSNRSLCQLRMNNNAAAEKDASSAIYMDSSYVKAFRHRGLARHAMGKLQEGIDDLKKVLEAVPGDTKAALELKTMEEKLCNSRFLPKRVGPMIIEEIQEETTPCYSVKGNSNGIRKCAEPPNVQKKQDLKSEDPRVQKSQPQIKTHNIQKISPDFKADTENKPTVQNIQKTQPDQKPKAEIKSTDDVDALKYKRKTAAAEERTSGNALFNSGKYLDAINVYSKSLELDPNAAATYTNRALCYLKINQPEKAIDDCTQAIALDAENYKAYYRRAISKKQICDFTAALDDLKVLRKLYPDDSTIKTQIDEIETLLPKCDENENDKAMEATLPVNGLEKSCDAPSNKTSLHLKEILENEEKWKTATVNGTPKTALEFERAFMSLVKQPEVLKHYIQSIEPTMYPRIFKEDLNARHLKQVGNFIRENVDLFEPQEIINILQCFIGVKRFKVAVMLLQQCEKDIFKMLLETISKSNDKFALDVSALKNEYMCK